MKMIHKAKYNFILICNLIYPLTQKWILFNLLLRKLFFDYILNIEPFKVYLGSSCITLEVVPENNVNKSIICFYFRQGNIIILKDIILKKTFLIIL